MCNCKHVCATTRDYAYLLTHHMCIHMKNKIKNMWVDTSVGKVLVTKAWDLDFAPYDPCKAHSTSHEVSLGGEISLSSSQNIGGDLHNTMAVLYQWPHLAWLTGIVACKLRGGGGWDHWWGLCICSAACRVTSLQKSMLELLFKPLGKSFHLLSHKSIREIN